ncbi:MAG: hypothetical protein Q4F06_09645 [Eubacteriales bacterium]|nr:hypothetical protein [Eubacteriales bacterium]
MKTCAVIFLFIIVFSISACGGKNNYVMDNEPQYYMGPNAAASENGYYYLAAPPVFNGTEGYRNYLYYYDINDEISVPLCSKIGCKHDDENCEAYLSESNCLGSHIWYINGRIYMIERTSEQDTLVSYDSKKRNKRTEAVLSVDGLSVNMNAYFLRRAVITHGELIYILVDESSLRLYSLNINTKESKMLKEYKSQYNIRETITLYAIDDKVYITYTTGYSATYNNYILDVYDIKKSEIEDLINVERDYPDLVEKVKRWNDETCFDHEGNVYFKVEDENKLSIYKINTVTGKMDEFYSIDVENSSAFDYIKFYGYDGDYLHLYEGVDVVQRKKLYKREKGPIQSNKMHVIALDGKLIEKQELIEKNQYSLIEITRWYGGDKGKYFFATRTTSIENLEFGEQYKEKYNEMNAKVSPTSGISPSACQIILYDKQKSENGEWSFSDITIE